SVAIVGLANDQAWPFLTELRNCSDATLVAIVETNRDLIARYQRHFDLDPGLFVADFETMRRKTRPQAAAVFGPTIDHRAVVEDCAAHGMDVLLEKPLAVNLAEAKRLAAAAKKGAIEVIVDYETTWFPGYQTAYELVHNRRVIGAMHKVVVRAGHRGPKEIGCSSEFLEWLTDPSKSGGGALIDFGCYGADVLTWLMDGERPNSVMAATQQIKPTVYPNVEDEATVVLEYPGMHAVIEASWNWPYELRELQVFGSDGYVLVPQSDVVRMRKTGAPESQIQMLVPPKAQGASDDLSYLLSVVRRQIRPTGMSSLDLNLTVMEIMDAARESARTGRRIELKAVAAHD
ncbi:MAG TPA: Gfo/Idh/MocA family oxidoreductase, partial [Verrucomicrobiae bacterium]|nr:Gfo/Idh/MocA family oxidoreductase [Verrucomicrobiae bacterium]